MLPLTEEDAVVKTHERPKLIEIVSHCYATELPQYAAMLVYQASSLVLHKPKQCKVCLSVCVWGDIDDQPYPEIRDICVGKVLPWTKKTLSAHDISWLICYMTKGELGRRCIGRNRLALNTEADIVWFADVDQVFRDGMLDRLATMEWPENASMIFPREIKIHRDWKTGDERTGAIDLDDPCLVDVDPMEFVPKQYHDAIGGVQIVRGDFVRKHGYLAGDEKWQRPSVDPFGDFRDDVAYRRYCRQCGPIVRVDLPGMYRLRHTRTTYQEDKM